MPSVSLSATDTTLQETKKQSAKKAKNQSPTIAEKKSASKLLSDPNTPDPDQDGVSGKLQKKAKKRKASDIEAMAATNDADEDTSSELVEPESSREDDHKKKKKKKKAKSEEQPLVMEAEEKEEKKEDPNAVSKFRISEPLRLKLKEKGIESLFPIQAMTFDLVLDGSDLVGRARTGQVSIYSYHKPLLSSFKFFHYRCQERYGVVFESS